MRKLIWVFVAICNVAVAQSPPTILGMIRNRAQGEITLTTEKCQSDPDKSFVFVRDEGGRLSLTGCWKLVEYNVLVSWSDGDVYSYPVSAVNFTPEFNEWYKQRRTQKNNSSPIL